MVEIFQTPFPFLLFSVYYLVYNLVGSGGVIRDISYVLRRTTRNRVKWLTTYAVAYSVAAVVLTIKSANEILLVFLLVFIIRRYRSGAMHQITAWVSITTISLLWVLLYHPNQILSIGETVAEFSIMAVSLASAQPLLTLSTVVGSSTLLFAYLSWKSSVIDDQWEIDRSLQDRLLGVIFSLKTNDEPEILGTITQVRVVEKQDISYNLRKYLPRGKFEGYTILAIDFESNPTISEGQLRKKLSHREGIREVRLVKSDRVLVTLNITRPLVLLENHLSSVQSALESSLTPPEDKKLGHGMEMTSSLEYHHSDSILQRLKCWKAERLLDFLDYNTFPSITVQRHQNGHSPPVLIVNTDLGQSKYPRAWPHETGGISIYSALESIRHAHNDARLREGEIKQYEDGEEYATFDITIRSRRIGNNQEVHYETPVVNFQLEEASQFTFYNSTAERRAQDVDLFSITKRGVDADFIAIENFSVYVYYNIGEQYLDTKGEREVHYIRMKYSSETKPELSVIRESETSRDDHVVWYDRSRYLGVNYRRADSR